MSSGICEVSGRWCPSLDWHHSVPREFGGENSPLIGLCPDVHATIHRCATNPKMEDEFFSTLPPDGRKKAQSLIQIIRDAKATGYRVSTEEHTVRLNIKDDLYKRLSIIQTEMKYKSIGATIVHILEKVIKV